MPSLSQAEPTPMNQPAATGRLLRSGLAGFALSAALAGVHLAIPGLLPGPLLAAGLFIGGLLQLIAGVGSWRGGSLFMAVILAPLGLFWLSLIALAAFPDAGWSVGPDPSTLASYLAMWGVFSLALCLGTSPGNAALRFFLALASGFFFLYAAALATSVPALGLAGGAVALLSALAAIHLARAGKPGGTAD